MLTLQSRPNIEPLVGIFWRVPSGVPALQLWFYDTGKTRSGLGGNVFASADCVIYGHRPHMLLKQGGAVHAAIYDRLRRRLARQS